MKIKLLSTLIICLLPPIIASAYDGRHGWFIQKAPQQLILCNGEGLSRAESMLLESLSGLCGQAVNEDSFDEMVWIEIDNSSYREILRSSQESLNITKTTRMDVWDLLEHLKKKKIIEGYILYKNDNSIGENYSRREGINYSANVATVYASLLKGILVEESLEKRIKP